MGANFTLSETLLVTSAVCRDLSKYAFCFSAIVRLAEHLEAFNLGGGKIVSLDSFFSGYAGVSAKVAFFTFAVSLTLTFFFGLVVAINSSMGRQKINDFAEPDISYVPQFR